MVSIIFLILLVLSMLIQLVFWGYLFSSLLKFESPRRDNFSPFVSIVVVFKNEAGNLRNLIHCLLNQKYPQFEIVMMDDFSTDGSSDIISEFDNAPNLKSLHASLDRPGKKYALTEALTTARGEFILLTDGDCVPVSDLWIQKTVQNFTPGTEFVLGFSPHQKSGLLLHKFIRLEGWISAVMYLSLAVMGKPYMGVGRNLAYTQKIARNPMGLTNLDIISGDDDLLVNQYADGKNTNISLDPDTYVVTYPKESWLEYIQQKRRHIRTAHRYKFSDKIILTTFSLSHMLCHLLVILLGFANYALQALVLFSLFELMRLQVASRLMKKMNCSDLTIFYVLGQWMLALFFLFLGPIVIFKKHKSWN